MAETLTCTNEKVDQDYQEVSLLENIKQLPASAEGVAMGAAMLGQGNFRTILELSLCLPDEQHLSAWDAVNMPKCLHFSCASDGPDGRIYYDFFINETFRPFSEEVICLLGKIAYSHRPAEQAC